ncbi:MAG TPA: hypothetical protein VMU92_05490 [Acidobacteriaceae bacterium]|nr:hypothetical protein [Acidobacteriaceae bacterium]
MDQLKRNSLVLAALVLCLGLTACHSPFVQTSIVNQTGSTVKLIEVDYPNASFGTQQIAENGTYHYHFQIQGPGKVKISYTGAKNNIYKSTGPELEKNQEGGLVITLEAGGKVTWTPTLKMAKTFFDW